MNTVVLIGGPLDGKSKPLTRQPPPFVWAYSDADQSSALRVWKSPGDGRHLYRHERSVGSTRYYVYAGHGYAFCCGAFHAKPEGPEVAWNCIACGQRVAPAERLAH